MFLMKEEYMIKTKYLILGAGPSGLTFATMLKKKNITDYIVLEKEIEPGGLCRSRFIDGNEMDIGGGHFLDVRNIEVNKFLFEFMPETEWKLFSRKSKIQLGRKLIDHPIEAHIWQLDISDQIEYLKSCAVAGCNRGKPRPEKFIEWIRWKLGNKIADEYMIPYNQKMFGVFLEDLGIYWLNKLPNVSWEDILRSCLERHMYGHEPAHTKFFYPQKYGYGEVWRRMGKANDSKLIYNEIVEKLDVYSHVITTKKEQYQADKIIVTIPWDSFESNADLIIKQKIQKLRHTSIITEYIPQDINSDAHWIYIPDLSFPYHRVLLRNNFLEGSRGHWTETNAFRKKNIGKYDFRNEYAYPVNSKEKPDLINTILEYFDRKEIYGLGRWGEHEHYNSDVCVEKAMAMAKKLVRDNK